MAVSVDTDDAPKASQAAHLFRYLPAIVHLDEHDFVLLVSGDEDRTTQSLRRRPLSRALCIAPKDLTVDMTGLAFADSSLMLDLAMLARRMRHAGRKVVIRGAQPNIQLLIELVGLDRLDGISVATT